jgi:uncharacterized protein involved in exopolysaccharide biosynthesis
MDAGVVRLRTIADSPGLAVAMAERLVGLAAEYNQERRQSRARAERVFVEARLEETQVSLDVAEESLEQFRRANRQTDDPLLVLTQERLLRRVRQHEQTYLQLSEALEQARINEVRDTPVFSILESAPNTVRPVGGLVRDVVAWAVIGIAFGILIALGLASYPGRMPAG